MKLRYETVTNINLHDMTQEIICTDKSYSHTVLPTFRFVYSEFQKECAILWKNLPYSYIDIPKTYILAKLSYGNNGTSNRGVLVTPRTEPT